MTVTLDAPARRTAPSALSRRTRRTDRAVPLGLFAAALASYAVAAAAWPTEWDSVSLVFGVDDFDVTQASPHAPGYWLYVALGRLVRAVTPLGAADSLLAASAVAAAATVALGWTVGRAMGGRWLGAATAGVLLTSPFVAFYGSSVGTYPFDALASLVLLHLAFCATPGSWHAPAAAAVLGLAGGVRQSSLLLLAPLAVVALVRCARRAPSPARVLVTTAVAGVAGVAVWLVPMALEQPGGLAAVREESGRMWRQAVEVSSAVYGAPGGGVRYNVGQATGYTLAAVALLLPVTAAAAVLARRPWRHDDDHRGTRPRRRGVPRVTPAVLLAIAALPPFAFVTVFHFGKAGYVLSYLPPLVLLLLWPARDLTRRRRLVAGGLVAAACAVQALRFWGAPALLPERLTDTSALWFTESRFGAPYRITEDAIRRTDADVERYRALGREFDPASDELVFMYMNGGHRFRHAMLTLPEFRMHYVQLGFHEWSALQRRWTHERDHVLELAPGARAVFVVDEPRSEMQALVDAGVATRVPVEDGPTAYAVPAGFTVYDVELVAGPAPAAPR
ncbi:MAG TPA: hypothetical protein VM242_12375 [Acidimicrobiales bacterium]|jgi:hypothetical protein|nr:hypothetical protein [Acidimicrobiales bacterium]